MDVISKGSLPNWEKLCVFHSSNLLSAEEKQQIEQLKSNQPGMLLKIFRLILNYSKTGHTYQKFSQWSWEDIVDIIHDQAIRNKQILEEECQKRGFYNSYYSKIDRNYNQLPCTQLTTQKRVNQAKSLCSVIDPILVLGDDDMIGLELVKEGFMDVTSVDIDPHLCKELSNATKHYKNRLKVYQHDISEAPDKNYIRSYKLVFLDPMYTLNGINMFLKSALTFTAHSPETRFFLSLHLMSLLRNGIQALPSLFSSYGLQIEQYNLGFNAYPIPEQINRWIKFFNCRYMRTDTMSSLNYMLRFFLSDAILLSKMNS